MNCLGTDSIPQCYLTSKCHSMLSHSIFEPFTDSLIHITHPFGQNQDERLPSALVLLILWSILTSHSRWTFSSISSGVHLPFPAMFSVTAIFWISPTYLAFIPAFYENWVPFLNHRTCLCPRLGLDAPLSSLCVCSLPALCGTQYQMGHQPYPHSVLGLLYSLIFWKLSYFQFNI